MDLQFKHSGVIAIGGAETWQCQTSSETEDSTVVPISTWDQALWDHYWMALVLLMTLRVSAGISKPPPKLLHVSSPHFTYNFIKNQFSVPRRGSAGVCCSPAQGRRSTSKHGTSQPPSSRAVTPMAAPSLDCVPDPAPHPALGTQADG